jgi:NADH-quinone oxidoreductase subunit L
VLVAVIGIVVAYVMYVARAQRPAEDDAQRSAPENLVYHKYYIDELYDGLIVKPVMALSNGLYRFVENGVIDPIANGFGRVTLAGGQLLRFVQTGSVETYLLLMVLGIVLILGLNFGKM